MKTDNTAFPTFSWGGAKLALSFSVFCQALLGLKYFVPRHKLGMKDWALLFQARQRNVVQEQEPECGVRQQLELAQYP